ncbi:MAG: hypothetical protein QM802_09445 [Agriterribacter sp.]
MPANDFEKQVQQIFDDFRLKPSQEVWPEVQKHIGKSKRKRRFAFWLFFGALLLGSGAFWFIKNEQHSNSIINTSGKNAQPNNGSNTSAGEIAVVVNPDNQVDSLDDLPLPESLSSNTVTTPSKQNSDVNKQENDNTPLSIQHSKNEKKEIYNKPE